MSINPLERIGVYIYNRQFAKSSRSMFQRGLVDLCLFIGTLEDILDERLGPYLPNARELVRKHCECVGLYSPTNIS